MLPTAAALGSTLPAFGPLFGFRALALVYVFYALRYAPAKDPKYLGRPVASLSFLWIASGVALSFIALDSSAAFRTLTSIAIGLLATLATLRIAATERRLAVWLARGWILSFFVTAGIAAWEIRTGAHLSNYYLDPRDPQSGLPGASFGNPNAYAVYLVGIQAVALWLVSRASGGRGERFLSLGVAIVSPILILSTGSRLCLLASMLLVAVFLAFDRMGAWKTLLGAGLLGLLFWNFSPSLADGLYEIAPSDVRNTSVSKVLLELDETDSSGGRRVELNKSAIWLALRTGGIGVGPGNYGAALTEYGPPYDTGPILSPHSLTGEIVAEFGIPLSLALVLLAISIVRRVSSSRGAERSVILALGTAMIPAGLANSGYLIGSAPWLLFATVLAWVVLAEQEST